jgi:prolipoprotein diacylglyceryltransferase
MACLGVQFPRGSFAWQDQAARHLISASSAASLLVYPVQLYESGLCLMLAAALIVGLRRVVVEGERFLALGIGYGVIRFLLEFLRADNPPVAMYLTFSQCISAAVVLAAIGTLIVRRRWAGALGLLLKPTALGA